MTKLYQINPTFARYNQMPAFFVANELKATEKAVYLFGQGTTVTKETGQCSICGRKLTHPVSVELGVGPECGKHWWDWNAVGGYSKENIERLTAVVKEKIKVDQWVPRSVIYDTQDTADNVETPTDHRFNTTAQEEASVMTKKAEQITYQKSGKKGIKITFPFDRGTVQQVKTIPGRKFHSEGRNKYWSAPMSVEGIEKLIEFGFEIDPALQQFVDNRKVDISEISEDVNIPGLNGTLFPFQAKGVSFLQARNGRALIADEMGLGKTVQALAWLQKNPKIRPAIIAVPASLKLNWKKEAEQWMEKPNVQILYGTKPTTPIVGDIIIINYDIVGAWVEALIKTKPQALIMDEIHYCKNPKAKRTKAIKKLAKGMPHVIGLTGTPIVNRPSEALTTIQLIDKSVAPNRWHYLQTYCDAKHNGFGWDFSGASNTEQLHKRLTETIMIRRKKADVLKDLPDKIRSFMPMELDNASNYMRAEQDFIEYLRIQKGSEAAEKASNAATLAEIEGLKQLAVEGKMQQAISWIKDHLENEGKLVVMAVHKFVINRLMEEFGDIAVKVDGSVSAEARNSSVKRFQEDSGIKLFVGNIKAAGVGLTLTAASTLAFLELPWTPGDLAQAEDRIHRIGQQDSVNIYYLLAEGTIEEKIAHLIDSKRKVLDSVLDGIKTEEQSLLSLLMKTYQ